MPLIGARPLGRRWAPQLVISGQEAPAEKYILDPSLPTLGHDPYIPNSDYIVIPRGRFLSVKNTSTVAGTPYANTSRPMLTLANGSDGITVGSANVDLKPMGFSEQQYFRQYDEQVQQFPQITKKKLVSVPYIQANNGAYGNMKPGDYCTAYYGSPGSGAVIDSQVGLPVKWQPRRYLTSHVSASGTVTLAGAIYPAFVPTVVMAWNAGTVVAVTGATYTYYGGSWQTMINGGAAVTDVLYHVGQDADNIAGQVSAFEAVGTAGGTLPTSHEFEGWLEWVRDDFGVWAFPPLAIPRPYTNITTEFHNASDSSNIGTNQFRLAQFPVVPKNQVTITLLNGSRLDPITGILTTYTSGAPYIFPLADSTYYQDWTYGQDYSMNPITGVITFSNNISVTTFTVSYSAETSFLDGKIYNPGVIGLTDGAYSGQAGTPAHLELFGVVADMHILTI